jgi:hypothetical protein
MNLKTDFLKNKTTKKKMLQRLKSSEIRYHIPKWLFINILENSAATTLKVCGPTFQLYHEDGGSKLMQNVK